MNQVAYAVVKLARDSQRPTGLDYIQNIFQDFVELHGDRRYADDPAIVGGIARLGEMSVTVVAIEKGHTAKQRSFRNFGAPHPEGYRKALWSALWTPPVPTAALEQKSGDRDRPSPKI